MSTEGFAALERSSTLDVCGARAMYPQPQLSGDKIVEWQPSGQNTCSWYMAISIAMTAHHLNMLNSWILARADKSGNLSLKPTFLVLYQANP